MHELETAPREQSGRPPRRRWVSASSEWEDRGQSADSRSQHSIARRRFSDSVTSKQYTVVSHFWPCLVFSFPLWNHSARPRTQLSCGPQTHWSLENRRRLQRGPGARRAACWVLPAFHAGDGSNPSRRTVCLEECFLGIDGKSTPAGVSSLQVSDSRPEYQFFLQFPHMILKSCEPIA